MHDITSLSNRTGFLTFIFLKKEKISNFIIITVLMNNHLLELIVIPFSYIKECA